MIGTSFICKISTKHPFATYWRRPQSPFLPLGSLHYSERLQHSHLGRSLKLSVECRPQRQVLRLPKERLPYGSVTALLWQREFFPSKISAQRGILAIRSQGRPQHSKLHPRDLLWGENPGERAGNWGEDGAYIGFEWDSQGVLGLRGLCDLVLKFRDW